MILGKIYNIFKAVIIFLNGWIAWYFAGPIAQEFGRIFYEIWYHRVHGGPPSWFSLAFVFEYIPQRGHAGYYAYLIGNSLCAVIVGAMTFGFFWIFDNICSGIIAGVNYLVGKFNRSQEGEGPQLPARLTGRLPELRPNVAKKAALNGSDVSRDGQQSLSHIPSRAKLTSTHHRSFSDPVKMDLTPPAANRSNGPLLTPPVLRESNAGSELIASTVSTPGSTSQTSTDGIDRPQFYGDPTPVDSQSVLHAFLSLRQKPAAAPPTREQMFNLYQNLLAPPKNSQ